MTFFHRYIEFSSEITGMSGVNLSRLSLIISLEIKSALVTGEESSFFSYFNIGLYSFKIALFIY